ncbi:hypothetical protein SD427_09640 [Chryseobacterium sp. JJR-5R]|nr:hypothetical protein [Chryseobacterium sp. JJR-5R]WPO81022.1 hypothetical protein SD427_09640 [Chryseobacterium sp. JJR-5R]
MNAKTENKEASGMMRNPVKILVLGIVALLAFGISISSQKLNAG